jgi:hypothetical protein
VSGFICLRVSLCWERDVAKTILKLRQGVTWLILPGGCTSDDHWLTLNLLLSVSLKEDRLLDPQGLKGYLFIASSCVRHRGIHRCLISPPTFDV